MFDIPIWAKALVVAVILAGAVGLGHHLGAAGVQADWDAAKLAAQEAKEKDEKAAALVASAHEKEVAGLRAQVRANKREVYDAVNGAKYRGCVADNALVGVWRKSYLPQADAAK